MILGVCLQVKNMDSLEWAYVAGRMNLMAWNRLDVRCTLAL
jgi:hypothetical protein